LGGVPHIYFGGNEKKVGSCEEATKKNPQKPGGDFLKNIPPPPPPKMISKPAAKKPINIRSLQVFGSNDIIIA